MRGVETISMPRTPVVFWAVMAVMALVPKTPSAAKVLRSAWMPAPPPESLPAIVSAVVIGNCRISQFHNFATAIVAPHEARSTLIRHSWPDALPAGFVPGVGISSHPVDERPVPLVLSTVANLPT